MKHYRVKRVKTSYLFATFSPKMFLKGFFFLMIFSGELLFLHLLFKTTPNQIFLGIFYCPISFSKSDVLISKASQILLRILIDMFCSPRNILRIVLSFTSHTLANSTLLLNLQDSILTIINNKGALILKKRD